MKAKLIKNIDGYELFTQGFLKGSTNHGLIDSLNIEEGPIRYKLSVKNCQAIENGYDLYELAKENYHKFWSVVDESEMLNHTFGYVEGFQKALEILGDKKFNEEDVILIAEYIRVASQSTPSVRTKDLFNEYQSLQQTEWDVEIVMSKQEYTWTPPGEGFEDQTYRDWREVPKLDATGCLILKLKL